MGIEYNSNAVHADGNRRVEMSINVQYDLVFQRSFETYRNRKTPDPPNLETHH